MKHKIPNFRPVDITILTQKYGYDQKLVPVYETIANEIVNFMKTNTDFTPDTIFLEHRYVVQGIAKQLKLDTIKVEKMLATLATGRNPLIKIRRNPTNLNNIVVTTTKNFWQNYTKFNNK